MQKQRRTIPMGRQKLTMDGNNAAGHVSYAFTDVAAIYPITPSSVMAEVTDSWSTAGRKNIFGQEVKVVEMQSESRRSRRSSRLSRSRCTVPQLTQHRRVLLLMIPNMYKIAGELLAQRYSCFRSCSCNTRAFYFR